jgi:hypothetical protein
VVDAFTVQNADESTKPIAVVFGLIGLYLYLEKGFTGRLVQQMHMRLTRRRKEWPRLPLPSQQATLAIADVLRVPPGKARDEKIHEWCESVWRTWQSTRPQIVAVLKQELDIG